jgi:nitroimidazol reductase NimA-like FMN-containing flavoprotein (pyridoxamine 5'-phosphate oxidase superfamily)
MEAADSVAVLDEDATFPATRQRVMGSRECADLLAVHDVGRVAWSAGTGPQILPVSYTWSLGSIAFRTSPYGLLSELILPTEVVFEIDDLDHEHQRGWSVVVHGLAQAVASPAELTHLWAEDGVGPWADGIRNLFIAVAPRLLRGRAFSRGA